MILVSGTGTGKTEGVLRLALESSIPPGALMPEMLESYKPTGKKMLIIEPFKSIVTSKFRKWERFVHLIYDVHEDDRKKDICVAIIDKVIKSVDLGTFDRPRFDYIVIDESHLLTMSEYRQKCGLLLDFLRSQRINSRIIYMTGTPLFERRFLPEDTLCVQLKKEPQYTMTVNIYTHCGRPLEQMRFAIAKEIENGRKVVCVLRSKKTREGIIKAVQLELQREIRTDCFYSDAAETSLAKDIVERKQLGDIDIAFVTSVFSVGVDIEGEENAVMYTYQELNGIEVDQYANRLRRVPIEFNMYGLYRRSEYAPLKSFEKTTADDTHLLLERLNSPDAATAKEAEVMLDGLKIQYIVQNPDETWAINDTLYDIHRTYQAWDAWSAQWQVSAQYLRKMGYQVNLNPRFNARLERELDIHERNKYKTQQRNARYDAFMVIWTEHKKELRELYDQIYRTKYTAQQSEEPLKLGEVQKGKGENDDISRSQTVYTYDVQAIEMLLNFMREAHRNCLSEDEYFKAVTKSLINKSHKQLSINKIKALITRLKLQRIKARQLSEVIEMINALNTTGKRKTMSEEAYNEFIGTLIKKFWMLNDSRQVVDTQKMADVFEAFAKAYYHITKSPETASKKIVKIYARYDKSVEEDAYRKQQSMSEEEKRRQETDNDPLDEFFSCLL